MVLRECGSQDKRLSWLRGFVFAAGYRRSVLLFLSALTALALLVLSSCVNADTGGGKERRTNTIGTAGLTRKPRAVLVFIDRISLDDVIAAEMPAFDKIARNASLGLMNARVRYDTYGAGNYLVIGAGGRAIAGEGAGIAFNAGESLSTPLGYEIKASDLYFSRTGWRPPEGSVVHLLIEQFRKNSDTLKGGGTPGLLGDVLKERGLRVSVLGNADSIGLAPGSPLEDIGTTPSPSGELPSSLAPGPSISRAPFSYIFHREASCAAIDSRGQVPVGDVSTGLLKVDPKSGNVSTNPSAFVLGFDVQLRKSDFVVVDLGETSRVDEQVYFSSDARILKMRLDALSRADRMLASIVRRLDFSKDLLIVCTPTPTRKMIRETELLTPILICGPGFKGGTLSSPTTRTRGLISNFDIAPTILRFFGINIPSEMEGKSAEAVGGSTGSSRFHELKDLKDKAVYDAKVRATIFKLYVFPAIVAVLLTSALCVVRKDLVEEHPAFWSILFMWLLSGPLAFSLVSVVKIRSLLFSVPASIGAQFLLAAVVYLISRAASREKIPQSIREAPTGNKSSEVDTENGSPAPDGAQAGVCGTKSPGAGKNRSFVGKMASDLLTLRAVLLIASLSLLMVFIDPFLGSPTGSSSPFGTRIVLGGRFYGTGNAYMGLAVASAVLIPCLFGSLIQARRGEYLPAPREVKGVSPWGYAPPFLALTLFLMILTVFGAPTLGANAGGVITATCAGAVTIYSLRDKKVRLRQVLLLVLVLALILGAVIAIDILRPGEPSHLGGAALRIFEKGFTEALLIMGRKMAANINIALNSVWRFFVLSCLFSLVVFHVTLDSFRKMVSVFPSMRGALLGLAVAFAVSLVFNDTGIEPASMIILFATSCAFLLSFPSRRREHKETVPCRQAVPAL